MSKHNTYLRDENLMTLFSLNNLIIPEIQREYVWGNNRDVLDKFLKEIKDKANICDTCHHAHGSKNINIGFLYSYKPPYVKYESERILDEFLIDGQQRITTLFLLLLYRATIEDRLDDFISILRIENNNYEMGFNYKVRNLTHQFILQLIKHAQKDGDSAFNFVTDMSNTPYWFLGDYKKDPSIKSMLSAMESIISIFNDSSNFYYDYLITNIYFWHFKTETTSQGEELYITMNSRGEELSDNEMKKARVLPSDKLVEYGKKWEEWQTYFWRNRKRGGTDNHNADKGFNNFLACIENLESFYGSKNPEISDIEIYVEGLKYISDNNFEEILKKEYKDLYVGWFNNFLNQLWNVINDFHGEWNLINPQGGNLALRNDYRNKSIIRNKTMLLWPWMIYYKQEHGKIDDQLLIRILHFYYIRYNCYKRSATSIKNIIEYFIKYGGKIHEPNNNDEDETEDDYVNIKTFSEEEILLSKFYFSDETNIKKIESKIWEIQDMPNFIDGKDLGGNTIYDFFKDNQIIDDQDLIRSIDNFKDNINKMDIDNNKINIKRILLFYEIENEAYWTRQTPYYYYNYETNNWKRIVRTKHFIEFYKDFCSKNVNYEKFLEEKRKEFFKENKTINRNDNQWCHRKLVILYDVLSINGVWNIQYENVAIWSNQEGNTEIFINQDTIWNAKRYYAGQITLKENWIEVLKSKYNVTVIY